MASAPRDSLLQVCEQNQAALATALSIREEDVIMVWVSELLSLVCNCSFNPRSSVPLSNCRRTAV